MNSKSYSSGTAFPELEKDILRLYSMRFDPYAQRARLVLAAKGIKHEIVNINIIKKPSWFTERNPLGTLPVLEHDDGRTLCDSIIICNYLDAIYKDKPLNPTDAYTKAKHQVLVELFSKVTAAYLKALRTNKPESLEDLNKSLEYFEVNLNTDYFGGSSPAMVDYMIWPWFERFAFLKLAIEYEFSSDRFPKLTAWMERMKQLSEVQETASNIEYLMEFHKSYQENKPNYDIGL